TCLTKEVLRVINVPQVQAPSGRASSTGAASVSGYAKEPHHPGEYVSAAAANLVMTLVKEVGKTSWERDEPVTIGLGPGRATRDFCQHFSYLLQTDGDFSFVDSKTKKRVLRPITLVAISAGCPADEPEYASNSLFNMFWRHDFVSYIGLFANALVRQQEFVDPGFRRMTGIRQALGQRSKIDIVVTSMG